MPEVSRRRLMLALGGLLAAGAMPAAARTLLPLDGPGSRYRPPAFTQTDPEAWLNARPLRWSDLRGRVVLLDFWTASCVNCARSFPWLISLEQRYAAQGLQVVGIHTPEFETEQGRELAAAKAREHGLHHPVMLDDGFVFWNAIGNRYWPAYYLIDRRGRVRAVYVGETRIDSPQARAVEADLAVLLQESRP